MYSGWVVHLYNVKNVGESYTTYHLLLFHEIHCLHHFFLRSYQKKRFLKGIFMSKSVKQPPLLRYMWFHTEKSHSLTQSSIIHMMYSYPFYKSNSCATFSSKPSLVLLVRMTFPIRTQINTLLCNSNAFIM